MSGVCPRRGLCTPLFLFANKNFLNNVVKRRFRAHRVSGRSISCQHKRLATAATEVLILALTTAAWLGHPVLAAEPLERRGFFPKPPQRMITHIVERKTRNHICSMAGKCASRGVDQQESFSP